MSCPRPRVRLFALSVEKWEWRRLSLHYAVIAGVESRVIRGMSHHESKVRHYSSFPFLFLFSFLFVHFSVFAVKGVVSKVFEGNQKTKLEFLFYTLCK